jgi:hypothetical protein
MIVDHPMTRLAKNAQALSRRGFLTAGAAAMATSAAATPAMRQVILSARQSTGLVQQIEVLNDITIPITSPSAQSVPMQTNGTVIRVKTTGAALAAAADTALVTAVVQDRGHDTAGNIVNRSRTIKIRAKMIGPYNELTVYQPVLGEFYWVLDDFVYNQDATWKTTFLSVQFDAGWVPGAPAEIVTTVTRSDSLSYPPFPFRLLTAPWQRVASGGNLLAEVIAVNDFARDGSMIACAEVWAVDPLGTAGTVARASDFLRSPNTPDDATLQGHPAPTYQPVVSFSGLLGGKCYLQYRVKPWIGPPVESMTYGDAFPTQNPAQQIPVFHDTDNSHVQLFAVLSHEPLNPPAGKTVIPTNLNVTTVDISGVSTTMAGAIASNKVYADLGTLAYAIRRVNRASSAVTIADPVTGAATFSYQRPTLHDDLSGGVAVCPPVTGSVMGADAGAYSIRQGMNNTTNYPPGGTAFEIRSLSGLPSDDVRWRGQFSEGGSIAFNGRGIPSRTRLRGITADSTGVTTANNNHAFYNFTLTTQATEAAAYYIEQIDTRFFGTNEVSPTTGVFYSPGLQWHTRHLQDEPRGLELEAAGTVYTAGMCASIGSAYYGWPLNSAVSPAGFVYEGAYLGTKLRNVRRSTHDYYGANLNRPIAKGTIFFNVEFFFSVSVTMTSSPLGIGGTPIQGGEGWVNIHIYGYAGPATSQQISITNDGNVREIDNLIIRHMGSVWPDNVEAHGRFNIGYNDQGWLRVDKRLTAGYMVARQWAVKGDPFPAPETAASRSNAAYQTTYPYFSKSIVHSGGIAYQAKQFVPANTPVSDTNYWFNGGTSTVAYGAQPLRQGNKNFRYMVASKGNVMATAAGGETGVSPTSWYGIAWDPLSKVQATWANYYNNMAGGDFSPLPGGELVNRVPAGGAVAPFDLFGNPIPNDGTGAAGPIQIPPP